MNLKNFKKVGDDQEKAVFKNDKGHEITIAKKSLTKKHLEDLGQIPLHASDGADIESALNQQQELATAAQSAADAPEEQTPQAEPAPQPQPTQAAQPPQAEQSQAEQSQVAQQQQPQNPQQAFAKASSDYTAAHAQQFGQEAAQYAQDLNNGHITPETYQGLFDKKGTLGKIGTVFGLLVSGAGSGLSGQPNAMLDLMNREIDRDLQAQKESKENALNFYKANMQNEMNKSQLGINKAQVGKIQAETKGSEADNLIKSDTHAKNQMLLSSLHYLQNEMNKLPQGSPQRVQAQNTLNGVSQAAAAEVQQNSQKGAQKLGMSQGGYENITNQMHMAGVLEPGLENLAKQREDKELPGYGSSSVPLTEGRREQMNKILKYQQALDEYQHLANRVSVLGSFTKLDPKDKALAESIKSDLVSGYNDVKGLNRFTSNEEGLYNKVIPDFDKFNVANMFGANQSVLSRLKDSVQRVKSIEFAGMTPFSDNKNESKQPPESSAGMKMQRNKKTGETRMVPR